MKASAFVRFFGFFAILFLCASGAAGQVNRASITGTVTDPSGAVIAGVGVTARNVDTNVETTTVSNDDGNYLVPNLPPGTYALTFRKTGFKEIVQPSVTLISTQVAGINVAMQVGSASENITVTAEAPVLDSQSVAIGTNMDTKAVEQLPLPIFNGGRFVENFAVGITPGYSPYSNIYGAVVNGGQWFTKDYTVDGTSGTASIRGNSMATGPSMEAVQELQAQTSGLDAASAITTGGVMSFTLKSGTNQFHGSLFGYGQNEFLAANTWTNDLTGAAKTKRRAWDYGGSLGGPIFKDKLFFFGTFEYYTQTNFTLGTYSGFAPTADMLNGNFSALLGAPLVDGSGAPIINPCTNQQVLSGQIFDPATKQVVSGQTCYMPFTNNTVDPSRFSSVAQKINAIFQKDYSPQSSSLTANNRFVGQGVPSQIADQPVVKLDYDFSNRDRVSGSWIYNNRPNLKADSGGLWQAGSNDGGPLSAVRTETVKSDQFRIAESHTFSSNLLNVFNVTYNWYAQGDNPSVPSNWNSQLGFGNTGASNFPAVSFGNSINGVGVTYIGNTFQGSFAGATVLTQDTVTWTKGRHSFSFGGDFRAYQVNSHKGQGALSFNFSPTTTDGGFTSTSATGFGFASYLLGDAIGASQTTAFDLYGRRKAMTLYAQDSYKLSPKLTLTAGLRWQYAWRYHEKFGHWANYDLSQVDPAYGYPGKLVFANGGGDSFEKKEYWDGFGPEIGFAYSPVNKWVIRGSLGLTLVPPGGPYYNGVPGGFAPGFQGTNSVTTPFNWDAGYPGVFQPGNRNVDFSALFPLVSVDPHALMPAFTDNINVGVQYELTPDMRIEVAYVGNRGHHLPDTALAWNEGSSAQFLKIANANPGLNAYSNPVCSAADAASYGITYPYPGFCGTLLAAITPSPQVGATFFNPYTYAGWYYASLNYVGLPMGQTSYNSMVVDLVKRTGRGWSMDLNYTYSRTRGDTYSSIQEANGYYTPVQDFQNVSAAANSLTGYDLTHVIKGYVLYELPFGKGKRWLADKGGFLNGLVGGWQVAALVGYNTGQPIQIGINNPFWPLWGNIYPNFHHTGVYGPFSPSGYNGVNALNDPNYIYNYLSSSVATSPIGANTSATAFGTGGASDGNLRCPGQANENATLLKYLSFGSDGKYQLAMRLEFYNLFNRHYYVISGCGGTGSTNPANPNFAQVIGVQDNPRTGQFGLRFTF